MNAMTRLFSPARRTLASLCLLWATAGALPAAEFAKWDFAGAAGSQAAHPVATTAEGLSASAITRGGGIGATSGADSISSNGWTSEMEPDAGDYFEFSITADEATEATVQTISFAERRSGTGVRFFTIRSSLDGFTEDLTPPVGVPDDTTTREQVLGLTGFPTIRNESVTFRIYGYGAESASGTWRLANHSGLGGMVVAGIFGPADPETPGPTVVSMNPAHGAAEIPLDQEIILTFSENIVPGGDGMIHLRDAASNGIVRSFDVTANFVDVLLFADSNSIMLLSGGTLERGKTYYIEVPAGTFEDEEGHPSDAFGSPETSAFTTDSTPPAVVSLMPGDGASHAPVSGWLRIVFTEAVAPGDGSIIVRDSAGEAVETIAAGSEAVAVDGAAVTIALSGVLDIGGSYHVEIDAGAFVDPAGFPFAGISGSGTWAFSTSVPPVVINKFYNAATDLVELLVTGDGIPGTTVDMRGMILKDFSSNMGGDNGGKFEFTQHELWAAVPVGTLVVVSTAAESPDTSLDDDSPYQLAVGLADEARFTDLAGQAFNIAGTELVMIKAAGSPAAGVEGGIHALGAGSPGAYFHDFGGTKLIGSGTTGSNRGVYASNPTATIADFGGANAIAGEDILGLFGQPNNGTNGAFIAILRGLDATRGNGVATLTNATAGSPFGGTDIFGPGESGQSLTLTLAANAPGVTLTSATFDVPSALGTPGTGNITLAGVGAAGASVAVDGQTITVSAMAVTESESLDITIAGLSTPDPAGPEADGIFPVGVATSGSDQPPAPIAAPPALRVIVPIGSLRDVQSNGVAPDAGKRVAVRGVVTMGNFNVGQTSAFIQDGTGGINGFSFDQQPDLQRGQVVAIAGTVTTFRGLTEIVFERPEDVVPLGVAEEPEALTVPLAALLADPENYEGLLVRVENLSRDPESTAAWIPNSTIPMLGAGGRELAVRLQAASTAYPQPPMPATLTGIFSQFAPQSAAPFSGGYQLMPRDADDFEPGEFPAGGFGGWAAAHGIGGESPEDDFEGDGLTNFLEYALGLDPTAVDVSPGILANGTVSFPKGADAAADGGVRWTIEVSETLEPGAWTAIAATTEDATSITGTLPPGLDRIFVRLMVTQVE